MATVSFKEFSSGKPVKVVGNETNPTFKQEAIKGPSLKERLDKTGTEMRERASSAIQGTGEYQDRSLLNRGVGATAAVGSAIAKGALDFAPESVRKVTDYIGEKVGKGFEKVTDTISETDLFKGAAGAQHTDEKGIVKYVPTDTSNLEDVLSTVSQTGELAGTIAGAEGAVKTGNLLKKGLSATKTGTSEVIGKAKDLIEGNKAKNIGKELDASVQAAMPLEDKSVRIDSLREAMPESAKGEGGVQREGILGKSKIQFTPEDIERGKIVDTYIKGEKDPLRQIQKVNKGIVDKSTAVDTFLDENPSKVNFEDMRKYIEINNKPDVNIQKDPGAFEAYSRSNENALNTLYKTMEDASKESGDFGPDISGSLIRKARINVDRQIAKELGEEVFGTPQFKGIKAAEVSVRNTLNRMSEDFLRYPDQMENVNKMNDFISSAKQRGVDIDLNNPEIVKKIEDSFGLKKTPESDAKANQLAEEHRYMSNLYEARDNMIDKYQARVGKNKIQDAVKNNPYLKATTETIKRAVPFGLGTQF